MVISVSQILAQVVGGGRLKARMDLAPTIPPRKLPRVHLASQSARRRELLSHHGVEHDAAHPGIDDGLLDPGKVSARQWVASLAYLKAAAGARGGATGPVLGADTVCVRNGELLGQPVDESDARRMIRLLEGCSHEVVTGVALVWPDSGRREIFVDEAVVHVGDIGEARIDEYLSTGQWKGKAGAYNLSERIEAGWPITYEGDPSTVMGLPMIALLRRLERIGATVSGS